MNNTLVHLFHMEIRAKIPVYLNNKDLLKEIVLSKERLRTANVPVTPAECITPKLAEMLMLLVERYGKKPGWYNYSFLEEMKGNAILVLCANWHKFDESRFSNAFAYYTQVVYLAFIDYWNREEKQRTVRDNLLEVYGMLPSMTRQLANEKAEKAEQGEEPTAEPKKLNKKKPWGRKGARKV